MAHFWSIGHYFDFIWAISLRNINKSLTVQLYFQADAFSSAFSAKKNGLV